MGRSVGLAVAKVSECGTLEAYRSGRPPHAEVFITRADDKILITGALLSESPLIDRRANEITIWAANGHVRYRLLEHFPDSDTWAAEKIGGRLKPCAPPKIRT